MMNEAEAEKLIKKAEKEKSRWFASEETKAENACVLLEKAANVYKSLKNHKQAAECFVRCATLKQKIESYYDAAKFYKQAGIQLKLVKDPSAMQMYGRAVDIFAQLGKGKMAADMSKDLGEQCERAGDVEDAVVHFERAADLYRGEGSDAHARQVLEKVAMFIVDEDISKAAKLFEDIGTEALSTRMGKYNARKFFFRSFLCSLADADDIGADANFERFKELDFKLETSREGKFMAKILQATKNKSSKEFSQAYVDYHEITPFDPWHQKILKKALKVLQGGGVGVPDEGEAEATPKATAGKARPPQEGEAASTAVPASQSSSAVPALPAATEHVPANDDNGGESSSDDDEEAAALFS